MLNKEADLQIIANYNYKVFKHIVKSCIRDKREFLVLPTVMTYITETANPSVNFDDFTEEEIAVLVDIFIKKKKVKEINQEEIDDMIKKGNIDEVKDLILEYGITMAMNDYSAKIENESFFTGSLKSYVELKILNLKVLEASLDNKEGETNSKASFGL